MPFLTYNSIGIRGLAAAVPKNVVNNYEYTENFSPEEASAVIEKIGIFERRFASEDMCSSDLSYAAADRLIEDLAIDRSEVDLLVFVSQTPDFRMPATSVILQNRLNLSNSTMAFDVNLACSGYVYGLSVVYALMQQASLRNALLLVGETRSRVYSPKDRTTAFLFGDGGTATLIQKDPRYQKSYFSTNSDGSRESLIKMKAGGYRFPSSPETLAERIVDEKGNIRSDEHGFMKGADVFNFVLKEIPRDISRLTEYSGQALESLDYYFFHQANSFMNSYLAKKLRLPEDKVPSSIHKFGNTSSVSIPLTIVSEFGGENSASMKVLMSGFGAGMSWASGILNLSECSVCPLVEI